MEEASNEEDYSQGIKKPKKVLILIKYFETCWNSTYEMLARVYYLHEPIMHYVNKASVLSDTRDASKDWTFTVHDWKAINCLLKYL